MKTVSVALVLCLNVGVDPPDVVKISPCARLECWIGKMYIHFKNINIHRLIIIDILSVRKHISVPMDGCITNVHICK